jgi:hypothetical protein
MHKPTGATLLFPDQNARHCSTRCEILLKKYNKVGGPTPSYINPVDLNLVPRSTPGDSPDRSLNGAVYSILRRRDRLHRRSASHILVLMHPVTDCVVVPFRFCAC